MIEQTNGRVDNNSMQSLSILIVTRNRRSELKRCLQSVLDQDIPGARILVLDNASSDGTGDMLEGFGDRITTLRMPANYGDWEARNIALQNIRAKYVFCLDDDAWCPPGTIRGMLQIMEGDQRLAVLQPMVTDPITGFIFGGNSAKKEHYACNFLGGAALYRYDALCAAGGFPHYLLGGAELHLALRFLDMELRILRTPKLKIWHHQSQSGRVPAHRLYYSTIQKVRAISRHCPSSGRAILEIAVKTLSHVLAAAKTRNLRGIWLDPFAIIFAGVYARRWHDRVRLETWNRMDWLELHNGATEAEYDYIDTSRGYLLDRILNRQRINQ